MDQKVVKLIGKKPGGARGRGKGRGRGRAKVGPPPTVPANGFEGADHEEEREETEVKDEVPKNKPPNGLEGADNVEKSEEPEVKDEVPKKKTKGKGAADTTKESPDQSSLMATRWEEVDAWLFINRICPTFLSYSNSVSDHFRLFCHAVQVRNCSLFSKMFSYHCGSHPGFFCHNIPYIK